MNSRQVSSREIRRRMNGTSMIVAKAVPVIETLLHNDRVSRDKIVALESKLDELWHCHAWFVNRGFWSRLRWIMRGSR